MEEKMKRLDAMIGGTFKYEGQKITVSDVKIKGDKARIITDRNEIEVTLDDMLEEDLSAFILVKENGIMKNQSLVEAVLQNGTMYTQLQETLLGTIEKLQADKDFVAQAEAINNTVKSVIDLEKVRIQTFQLLK